jgi:hypothetical protein
VDPSGRFAYVGNNGFISAFAIDWQTGGLTQIRGSPFPAEGAYAMALDPSGRFAYVATDSPFIGAFTIDQVTGALRPMSGSPFLAPGGTPISVAVDANGQFAYFADFNLPYAVTAYAINHTTGMLTAVPGSPFAAGSFPFSVATTPGPASLRFSGVLGTGGSFSSDDNYRHAFVGQPNGSVWEIYWDRPMNQGQDLIANFDPHAGSIAGLASTFGFGNVRHALVATDDGNLTDIVFSPNQPGPPRRTLWANFDPRASSLVAVGAYARQGFEVHAIVATSDGDVADVYQPAIFPGPVQVRPLTNFDPRASGPIVGIAGLFSSDQNFEHAIVGTLNGDVTEVFYRTGQPGIGRALLAHFPPSSTIVGVGGFFSGDDNYRHAIVATSNGNVTEIFYNPYLGQGQVVLANFDPAVSTIAGVAGFFSPDDNFRHVLVATSDGNIHEILYSPVTAPMIVREL